MSRRLLASLLGLGGLVWSAEAGAVDIFELEPSYLQRRLDEAWAYSVESRARRGGVHWDAEQNEGEGNHAIFAMSMLLETGPEHDGFHLAASMVNLSGEEWYAFGHGPFFGYSRFASTVSQDLVLLSGLHVQDSEADVDHLFAGWNFGIRDVFLELGWRWRWERTAPTLVEALSGPEAGFYAGRKAKRTRHAPFAKVRVGGTSYGLKVFFQPGEDAFLDPQQAYFEPSYRLTFGDEFALTSELSYKRVRVTDDTPRARAAITETLTYGRERAESDDGKVWHNRKQLRVSVENLWAPDQQGMGDALGTFENYVFRVETEPLYAGAWYNERFGFGWGLGIAATSEWEENGQTMRLALRYMRNYIYTEPTADPTVPWLIEFSGVVGW